MLLFIATACIVCVKYAILAGMKGLIAQSKIQDSDLDILISKARKNSGYPILVVVPSGETVSIMLEVTKLKKGWSRVAVDTWKSGYDITPEGQKAFLDFEKSILDPEDRREVACGSRVMRIDVRETGEGMILAYILCFLENPEHVQLASQY